MAMLLRTASNRTGARGSNLDRFFFPRRDPGLPDNSKLLRLALRTYRSASCASQILRPMRRANSPALCLASYVSPNR